MTKDNQTKKQWAEENKVNLEGADLKGADLKGADLEADKLSAAYMTDARLRGEVFADGLVINKQEDNEN